MPDVDHAALQRLLDLQAEDSAIARLNERAASLPEAARLSEVKATLKELGDDIVIATKQDEETGREQHRLEGEIELLEQQAAREDQRMLSGAVSNPKELSALQAKIAELKNRKVTLEDKLIEVMEAKEHTEATLSKLQNEQAAAEAEASTLSETVTKIMAEIEADLGEHQGVRSEVATTIPEDLVTLYERLKGQKHGVGAAALEGGTCQGCHTKLPAVELEKIRAEGGLQRCENCRRILVVV